MFNSGLNKIFEFFKKNQFYFIIFFSIMFSILIWKYYKLPPFRGEWASCVDYIKDGILYQGQPKCYHGIVNYLISYLLINYFPNNFLVFYKVIMLISVLLLYFLIYKIIKNQNLKHHYLLLSLLFFTLYFTSSLLEYDGDAILATPIMLSGFYILYYLKKEYKYLLSSTFFTIAILTKLNVLMPIILLLAYYFKDFFIENHNIKINYKKRFNAAILTLLPPLIILVILKLLFKNIFTYLFLVHIKVENYSLLIKLNEFFSGYSGTPFITQMIFLILVLSIPAYWFFKKRDIFSFTAFFGFLLIIYGMIRGHEGYYHRYFMPVFPFLLITIVYILNNIKSRYKKLIFISILLILSISSLKLSDPYLTSSEFRELKNTVDSGFKFLPNLSGKILSDNDYFLRFNKNINRKQVEFVLDKYGIDSLARQRFETLGISVLKNRGNETIYITTKQEEEINKIGKKILTDYYSAIILGLSPESSPITQIIEIYKLNNFNKATENFPYKTNLGISCEVAFPSLMTPCQNCNRAQIVLFTNLTKEECNTILTNLIQYYIDNYDNICGLDQEIAQLLNKNVVGINKPCNSNNHLLKDLYGSKIATIKELIFLIIMALIVLLYYNLKIKKTEEQL